MHRRLGGDQQIAAAARAADLAAGRARGSGRLEHAVDRRAVGHERVHLLLRLERVGQERTDGGQVAALDRVSHGERHLLQALHPQHRVFSALAMHPDLSLDQTDVTPDGPRVAEQEVAAQFGQRAGTEVDGPDPSAGPGELDQVEAAVGRRVLVLPAAADAQILALDPVREIGHFGRRQRAAGEHRERADDRCHQRGRAPETAASGGVAPDLHVDPRVDADPIDRRLRQVHDAVVVRSVVEVVLDEVAQVVRADRDLPILAGCEANPDRMFDRRRQHGAAMLLVPMREVGATSHEADPQGRGGLDRAGIVHRPSVGPVGCRLASGHVALEPATLLLGRRAPDTVALAVLERPGEALLTDRAGVAERQGRPGLFLGDREEDVGVDSEACGSLLPEIGGGGIGREGLEINFGEPVDPHLVAPPLRPASGGRGRFITERATAREGVEGTHRGVTH
jgi:hypothetical protein